MLPGPPFRLPFRSIVLNWRDSGLRLGGEPNARAPQTAPLTRSASKTVLTLPHSGVLGQARTSLMRASMLSEGSLKNDIQSSWSGIRAIRWGSSTNWTPRSIIVDLAASRSSTLK